MKLVCFHSFKRATSNPQIYRGKLSIENFAQKNKTRTMVKILGRGFLGKLKLAGLFSK